MKFTGSTIYRIFSIFAVIAVMAVIFWLSAQNGEESSQTSGFVGELLALIFKGDIAQNILRTFAHFLEYAVLGFLMYNVFYSFNVKLAPVVSVSASLLYALSDEIHQYFVPGRACAAFDVFIDSLGVGLAVALFALAICVIKPLKRFKNFK